MQQTASTTGLTPNVSSDVSANHLRAPPAYPDYNRSLSLMRGTTRSRDDLAPLHGISIPSTDYSSPGAFMGNSISSGHLSYNSGGSHPSATPAFSQGTNNDHNLMLQAHYQQQQQQQQQFASNPAPGYQTFVYASPQGHPSNMVANNDIGTYGRSPQPSKGTNPTTTTTGSGTSSKKRKATGQTCPPYDLPSTLRKLLPQFEHIDCELSEADVAPLLDIEAALLEAESIPPSVYPPSLDKVNSAANNCAGDAQVSESTAKPRGAKRNAGTYMDLPLSYTSPVIPLRTVRFYAPDFTRVFEIPLHHLHCTQGLINHLVDVSIKGPTASRSRLLICEHVYNSALKPWLEFIDEGGSPTNALLQSFRRTTTQVRKSLQGEDREKLPEEEEVDFPKAPTQWSKAGDEQPANVYKYARALAELYGKLNRSTWCPLGSKCPDLHPHFVADGETKKKEDISFTDNNNIIESSSPDNSCEPPNDIATESNTTPNIKNTPATESIITIKKTTTTMPAFAPHPTLAWSTVHANTHAAEAHMCFTSGFDIPIAAPNELCASEKIPSGKVFVTKGALEFFETTLLPADNSLPQLPPLAHLVISSEASASDTTTIPQQDDVVTANNTNATTPSQAAVRSVLQHCAHFSKNGICALGAECLFVHAVGYSCPSQLAAKPSSDDTKVSHAAIAPPGAALRVPSNEESNSRNDAQQQQQQLRASRKAPRNSSSQPQFVTSVPTTAYYSTPQQAQQQQQAVYARGVPLFQQPQYPHHSHQPATNTPPVNTAMNLDYHNLHNGGFGQQQMNNNHGGGAPTWSYIQQPQPIQTQQQQQQHIGHHNAPSGMTSYVSNPFPSMFPTHHHHAQQQQQPSFGGAVGGGVGGAHLGMWPGHPTSRSAHK